MVQVAIYAAAVAKLRRDNMGTVSSSTDCGFFQITYLPLKLHQSRFVWDSSPLEGIIPLIQSRTITVPAQITEVIACLS